MNALRPFWFAPAVMLVASAFAQQQIPASVIQKVALHIDPQPVGDALSEFGRQTGLTVMIQSVVAHGLISPKLDGNYTPTDALERLLAHTGLHYEYLDAKTVAVLGPRTDTKTTARRISADETEVVRGTSTSSDGLGRVVRLASSSATASENAPADAANESVDDSHTPEILVRGSRVMNVDVKRTEDDVQPYYILDSKQIEQSAAVNLEDFLKQHLTMDTTTLSNSQSIGVLGNTSTINLRGLGANETLILIDGHRSASVIAGTAANQPDINAIPLFAIERIEVLPSSASAIYGGAAVGGVVNIILKKNYQGGEFGYTFENTTNASAPIRTLNASFGFSPNGGKTQIMAAGHYSEAHVLNLEDRLNLVQRGYANILANDPTFFISNPSTPIVGATPNIGSADGMTNLSFKSNGVSLNSPIATVAPGASVATPGTFSPGQWNLALAPTTESNGLLQPLGSAPRIKSLMISIRQELTSTVQLFTELSTQSNISVSRSNPIDTNGGVFVPTSSPANPFNQDVNVSFANTVSVPFVTDSVTQSMTVGALARLPADWKSELDYTWSRNSVESKFENVYDYAAFGSDIAAGVLNPFVDTLAHPLNLAPYVGGATEDFSSTLNDLGLRSSGPMGAFPWGRPSLTIGLEHRKEGTHNGNYYNSFPQDPANSSHTIYFGQSQSTSSIYLEAQVPIVTAKNSMLGVRSLDLQLAGRSEQYKVHTGTPSADLGPDGSVLDSSPPQGVQKTVRYSSTNPTAGFKYKPIDDLTFRVSYAKAFLPPTALQFLPNPTPSAYTIPINDPQSGETYPVRIIQGGNPNLQPQTATDWDLGVIFEPQEEVLEGMRIDLEYYRITQPNYITIPSAQSIVSTPAYSSRVTRDATTGRITLVDTSYVNATQYKTSGWDLAIDYRRPTEFGVFHLHALGTVIEHDRRQYTIGGPAVEYAGFPNDGGEAKIKWNGTLSWEYRHWVLGWTTTYFGTYMQTGSPNSPFTLQFGPNSYFAGIAAAQGGYSIPSQMYHEVFGSYSFGDTPLGESKGIVHNVLSRVKVTFGVKNLFNTLPPFDAYSNPYYYSTYGDPRLRDYWIGISKSF